MPNTTTPSAWLSWRVVVSSPLASAPPCRPALHEHEQAAKREPGTGAGEYPGQPALLVSKHQRQRN
jgi:hypothetical protein